MTIPQDTDPQRRITPRSFGVGLAAGAVGLAAVLAGFTGLASADTPTANPAAVAEEQAEEEYADFWACAEPIYEAIDESEVEALMNENSIWLPEGDDEFSMGLAVFGDTEGTLTITGTRDGLQFEADGVEIIEGDELDELFEKQEALYLEAEAQVEAECGHLAPPDYFEPGFFEDAEQSEAIEAVEESEVVERSDEG